jgi:hypothetical protein
MLEFAVDERILAERRGDTRTLGAHHPFGCEGRRGGRIVSESTLSKIASETLWNKFA